MVSLMDKLNKLVYDAQRQSMSSQAVPNTTPIDSIDTLRYFFCYFVEVFSVADALLHMRTPLRVTYKTVSYG